MVSAASSAGTGPSQTQSPSAAAVPTRAAYLPTQEVRFAVVLYGGVSLAVYINGVVQELFNLVRATAPERPPGQGPWPDYTLLPTAGQELRGTEKVYRKLGQMLAWGESPSAVPNEAVDPPAPVRTRFVVDILSGSSAGGINGVFLAKALANGQQIDDLKRLWVEEGDIAVLINDRESVADIDGLRLEKPPPSLLNSRRMYWRLLEALGGMDEGKRLFADGESCFVDELDLWLTATDLQGLLLPIDLYDRVVYEPRHRNVFHFRSRNPYATGETRNDFGAQNDPFLAFAARCTSSFPFAFDPMTLEDMDEIVGADAFRAYARRGSTCEDWDGFFADYLAVGRRALQGEDVEASRARYRRRAFADGGYLDNKPFTYATEALARRRADLPVDRRLIYIEPDPGRPRVTRRLGESTTPGAPPVEPPPAQPTSTEKPNALANALLALTSLPRTETIREDLDRLLARNRHLARLAEVAEAVDPFTSGPPPLPDRRALDEWLEMPIVEILDQRGFCYAAYHRLKIASVLDELALTVTRLAGYEGQSDELSAIRCFVQAWFELRYESDRRGETGGELRQNRFLYDFDFGYRARRLNFLQERVSQLLPLDRQATRILEQVPDVSAPAADAEADFRTALGRAKRDLNDEYVGLRSRAREVQRDEELQRAVRGLQIRPAELRAVLERAKDRGESVGRAKRILAERDLLDAFDHAARQLADAFGNILRDSSNRVRQQLAVPPDASAGAALALQVLRHLHEHFEDYDLVLFLTAYGQAEEADRVEVIRISPEDARSLIDETSPNDGRRKLAGVAVHHFGGFFDRAWRKNDIMWGRLDAAERLITTLLPEPHQEQVRNELLREAQLEIVREEFDTAGHNELLALLLQASLELRPRGSDQTDARVPKKENVRVVRSALEGVDDARLTAALASTWTPEQILDFLGRGYEVDSTLDSLAMLGVAGRASQVTGSVLDGISEAAPIPWTSRWMIRVGRMLWGLAEVATPRSAPQLLWRYWSQLLLLIAATLILGGALFGNDGTSKAGWILVALTLAAKAVVWIASDLLGPRRAPSDGRFAWLRRGLAAVGRSLSTALGAVRLGVRWVAQRVLPVRIFLALLVAAVAGLLVLGAINVPEEANDLVKKLPDWLEDALRWIWPWDDGKGATSS